NTDEHRRTRTSIGGRDLVRVSVRVRVCPCSSVFYYRKVPSPPRRPALLSLAALLAAVACASGEAPPGAVVRISADTIEFPATVAAAAFNRPLGMPGYHAIVWRGGRAAGAALFRAEVTDVQVLDALEGLGATPGNRLGMESWEARHNPESPAPDQVI